MFIVVQELTKFTRQRVELLWCLSSTKLKADFKAVLKHSLALASVVSVDKSALQVVTHALGGLCKPLGLFSLSDVSVQVSPSLRHTGSSLRCLKEWYCFTTW